MSLNGLDAPAVHEAFQAASSEQGGWFLLKYASRDELEIFDRGCGGVGEMRRTIAKHQEASPLYGFLRYRRRNILVKFLPDNCSRLVKARVSVHHLVVCDRFAPFDTLFDISAAKHLRDSKLAAACSLHADSGSISSSTSSIRQRRLVEITEEDEEDEEDEGEGEEGEVDQEKDEEENRQVNLTAANTAQVTTSQPSSPTVSHDPTLLPNPNHEHFSPSFRDSATASTHSGTLTLVRRPSAPVTHSSSFNYYSTHSHYGRPKVKLAPRPSFDARPRENCRPVAALPSGLKLSTRKSRNHQSVTTPESAADAASISSHTGPISTETVTSPAVSEAPRPRTGSEAIPSSRPRTSSGVSVKTAESSMLIVPQSPQAEFKISPEKARLQKALQLRQKKRQAAMAAASPRRTEQPAVVDQFVSSPPDDKSMVPRQDGGAFCTLEQYTSIHGFSSPSLKHAQAKADSGVALDINGGSPRQSPVIEVLLERSQAHMQPTSPAPDISEVVSGKPPLLSDSPVEPEAEMQASMMEWQVNGVDTSQLHSASPKTDVVRQKDFVGTTKITDVSNPSMDIIHGSNVSDGVASVVVNVNPGSLTCPSGPDFQECDVALLTPSKLDISSSTTASDTGHINAIGNEHAYNPNEPFREPPADDSDVSASSIPSRDLPPLLADTTDEMKGDAQAHANGNTLNDVPEKEMDGGDWLHPHSHMLQKSSSALMLGKPRATSPAPSVNNLNNNRTSSNPAPLRGLLGPTDLTQASARSVSSGAPFVHQMAQKRSTQSLVSRSGKLGSAISQRIKAFEQLNATNSSSESLAAPVARPLVPSAAFFSVKKNGNSRDPTKPSSVFDRASMLVPDISRDGSPEPRPVTASLERRRNTLAHRLSLLEPVEDSGNSSWMGSSAMLPRGRPESVQVTARIIRDAANPHPQMLEPSQDPADFPAPKLHQSPLVVNVHHQADNEANEPQSPKTSTTRALIPEPTTQESAPERRQSILKGAGIVRDFILDRRNTPRSPTSTNSSPQGNPLSPTLRAGDDQHKHEMPCSESNIATEDKRRNSRASRFMKRLSASLTPGSRKNSVQVESSYPEPATADPSSAFTATAAAPMVGVAATRTNTAHSGILPAHLGEVNVQFPDSLLWKRRSMLLDGDGFLVLSTIAGAAPEKYAAGSKMYHLGSFRQPYVPDVEVQELPHSVVLDFVDGTGLQVACEDRSGQVYLLGMLEDAWHRITANQ